MKAQIFVGNLHFNVRNEDLIDGFKKFGVIKSVVIVQDTVTRKSKGYGFVEFESMDAAQNALAMNTRKFRGRALNVNMAGEK